MMRAMTGDIWQSRRQRNLLLAQAFLFVIFLCYFLGKPRYEFSVSGSGLWTPVGGTYAGNITKLGGEITDF